MHKRLNLEDREMAAAILTAARWETLTVEEHAEFLSQLPKYLESYDFAQDSERECPLLHEMADHAASRIWRNLPAFETVWLHPRTLPLVDSLSYRDVYGNTAIERLAISLPKEVDPDVEDWLRDNLNVKPVASYDMRPLEDVRCAIRAPATPAELCFEELRSHRISMAQIYHLESQKNAKMMTYDCFSSSSARRLLS